MRIFRVNTVSEIFIRFFQTSMKIKLRIKEWNVYWSHLPPPAVFLPSPPLCPAAVVCSMTVLPTLLTSVPHSVQFLSHSVKEIFSVF